MAALGAGRACLGAPWAVPARSGWPNSPTARSPSSSDTLPGKVPLIKKTFRPPNFETPIKYFRTAITRNDAFFVR